MLSHAGVPPLPLPTNVGAIFIIDDFDHKVTQGDMGFNYFMGNTGATESAQGITTISLSEESNGSCGNSLRISFDFTGQPAEGPFAGYFASLFGLTDTKVSLDGTGREPENTTRFPGYFLDTRNIYHDFLPLTDRSVEELRIDAQLLSDEDLTLKIELKDENDFDVFTRRMITSSEWQTIALSLPGDFTDSLQGNGDTTAFDWRHVSLFSLTVERMNVGAGISNPTTGAFLVDNIVLADNDGAYPDLDAIQSPADGSLLPQFTEAFLDHVRATSFQYFVDFASTDPRTGGIIQDRSTLADLMTVGGVGFQLTSYVIGSERGYISRQEATNRVHDILKVLHDNLQGPEHVGAIGYQGLFYHFLGIDGLRKQNFDVTDTPEDESLKTVELSTIDTALAIAGVVTAGQYFDGNSATELEIRNLADEIYARVNWPFMLNQETNRFYLGWKPIEERNGPPFEIPDDPINPKGHYSGVPGDPATIDFYTDEGILVALLAMGSPNPEHRIGREVWDAMIRDDEAGPFVKTFPGSLFTYQFASVWLDTQFLGTDNHPIRRMNFFENSRMTILQTRLYAITNPTDRATLSENRWGLSATEGPFDDYFAEAAPPVAIHPNGQDPMGAVFGPGGDVALEGENGAGDGSVMSRGAASGGQTVQLDDGEARSFLVELDGTAFFDVSVRYSNDNFGPLERVKIAIDGIIVGSFDAQDTGDFGNGWNVFVSSGPIARKQLARGTHNLTISASGGDGGGVEIDLVTLSVVGRPLEVGTVTNYGVGSSIVHAPEEAIAALWESARRDLNQDGRPDLLHPRFGFADAFNLDIADAVIPGAVDCNESRILRCKGPWANLTGFAIDHGPMLIMIDNYLEEQFVPRLFMSHATIRDALATLFFSNDGVAAFGEGM